MNQYCNDDKERLALAKETFELLSLGFKTALANNTVTVDNIAHYGYILQDAKDTVKNLEKNIEKDESKNVE